MSRAHLEQFIAAFREDPSGLEDISSGTPDPQQVIATVVQAGKASGYDFTATDIDEWFADGVREPVDGELGDAA